MLEQSKTLYDTDFNQWIEETVKHLQNKDFEIIDLENLIEEVADLGRNQKHWKHEICNFRLDLQYLLKDSPSLKPYLASIFSDCYQKACKLAVNSTGFPLNTFPIEPIGTLEQILDDDWFPTNF